jgi:predicted ATPase with chaperone activity
LPFNGKNTLKQARFIPRILPTMAIDEALVVTRIYSSADQLKPGMK